MSVFLVDIPELGLIEPCGESLALGRRAVAHQADLGVIGDVPKPLHVTGIALVVRRNDGASGRTGTIIPPAGTSGGPPGPKPK